MLTHAPDPQSFNNEWKNFRRKLLNMPISPAKKIIVSAMLDYIEDLFKRRTLTGLLFTNFPSRILTMDNILTKHLPRDDKDFINCVRDEINLIPEETSDLKKKLLAGLQHAEIEYEKRRAVVVFALHMAAISIIMEAVPRLDLKLVVAVSLASALTLLWNYNENYRNLMLNYTDKMLVFYDKNAGVVSQEPVVRFKPA